MFVQRHVQVVVLKRQSIVSDIILKVVLLLYIAKKKEKGGRKTITLCAMNDLMGLTFIYTVRWYQGYFMCSCIFYQHKESYMVFLNAFVCQFVNSYSASHDNWCTATLWNRIMTAQCEGMGEVGSARYEPALLPPCPSIRVLSYSNRQEIHSHPQTGLAV